MATVPAPLTGFLDPIDLTHIEKHAPVVARRWMGSSRLAELTRLVLEGQSPTPDWQSSREEFARQLRLGRNAVFAALTVEDLLHQLSPAELARRWSQRADDTIAVTWQFACRDTDQPTQEVLDKTTILGFGKLGGSELNLSSDIDIAFFAQPDSEGRLTVTAGLHRVLQNFLALLSDQTTDGFVYRTDLRLRPQGEQGNLIDSTDVALTYYRDMSAPWERLALLRCRPVGGNHEVGNTMLAELNSLLFRQHLDYIILEEILSVKSKIDLESQVGVAGSTDIKLGQGGIREQEFFIQALQLMHGGRLHSLQCRETGRALDALAEHQLLTQEEADEIRGQYWLLRAIENRIQQREDLQTHRYTGEDLAQWSPTLAHLTEGRPLAETLAEVQSKVHNRFASLRGEEDEEPHHPLTLTMLAEKLTEEEKTTQLRRAGIADPQNIAAYTLRFREGLQEKTYGRLTQRQFEQLAPRLLDQLWEAPVPARAIANLDRFVNRVGGRAEIYAMLRQNRALITLLLKLFSTQGRLTSMLLQSPSLIDSLVMTSHIEPNFDRQAIAADLFDNLPGEDDLQHWLESLTRWVNEQILQTGLHNLGGMFSHEESGLRLSWIADLTIRAILHAAATEVGKRFNVAPDSFTHEMQVVALGRYGGEELDFGSDLDVLFLHDEGDWNTEAATRVLQRLHHWMRAPNRWGNLFELDSRLRPSGKNGALLTTREGFLLYHREHAQPWEQIPLLKARAVTGDIPAFDQLLYETLRAYPPLRQQLPELDRIRKRNLHERGSEEEIKAGEGGILDLEFATSYGILANLDRLERPEPRLVAQLGQLADIGWIDSDQANRLGTIYRFLRALQGMAGLLALPGTWHEVALSWPGLQKLYPDYLHNLATSIGAPQITRSGADPRPVFRRLTDEIRSFYEVSRNRIQA